MATGPKNSWGGRRPGAGGPRTSTITDRESRALVLAAREAKKKYGRTVEQELLRLAFEAKDERTQLAAMKIYMDATQVKKSEVKTTKQVTAPIILPASRPDPAAEVVPLKKAE